MNNSHPTDVERDLFEKYGYYRYEHADHGIITYVAVYDSLRKTYPLSLLIRKSEVDLDDQIIFNLKAKKIQICEKCVMDKTLLTLLLQRCIELGW